MVTPGCVRFGVWQEAYSVSSQVVGVVQAVEVVDAGAPVGWAGCRQAVQGREAAHLSGGVPPTAEHFRQQLQRRWWRDGRVIAASGPGSGLALCGAVWLADVSGSGEAAAAASGAGGRVWGRSRVLDRACRARCRLAGSVTPRDTDQCRHTAADLLDEGHAVADGRRTTRRRRSAATRSLKARITTVDSSVAWGYPASPPGCCRPGASRRGASRVPSSCIVLEVAGLVHHQRKPGANCHPPARIAALLNGGPPHHVMRSETPARFQRVPRRWRCPILRSRRSTTATLGPIPRGPRPGGSE